MAPPICQINNNETIRAAVSEIVKKKHLKISIEEDNLRRALLTFVAVLSINLHAVITCPPRPRL
jgi:hypothetical protein